MRLAIVAPYWFMREDSGLRTDRDDGVYPQAALESVKRRGIGSLSTWADDESRYTVRPDLAYEYQARDHRVEASYQAVDVERMRGALSAGFPVVIAAELRESFGKIKRDGRWRPPSGGVVGGHMMTVYGRDDDEVGGDGYGRGCFHVLQTWGVWGDLVVDTPQWGRGSFRWPYEAVEVEPFLYDGFVMTVHDRTAGD